MLLDMFENMSPQQLQNMGLLGLSLMNQGNRGQNNPMLSLAMAQMMRGQNSQQQQQAAMPQTQPTGSYEEVTNLPASVPNSAAANTQLPADKQQMLMMLKSQAAQAYPDNPMMQQVAITQAIHESGLMNKPSQLASQYNNLFGIKASKAFPGTAGAVNMNTQEVYGGKPQMVNDGFARNASVADSFIQHRNLITGAKRYAPVVSAQNPTAAFQALQQAGYATDPRYANKLDNVYNRYVAQLYS
jgi:flagellar protein FlgJ